MSLILNLDQIAYLRAARRYTEPDPVQSAVVAELNGASGVAVQYCRDKKYIKDRDLFMLKGIVKNRFCIEMPPADDAIEKAVEIKPSLVIFSADHADSDSPMSTLEPGDSHADFSSIVNRLAGMGIETGFFIEAEPSHAKTASKLGANAVLINCSGYTEAKTIDEARMELDRIDKTAESAQKNNLEIYAGRGLSFLNIKPLAELGNIDHFMVGHSLCSKALMIGLPNALAEMNNIIRTARN